MKIAVLASGRGSNAENLFKCAARGDFLNSHIAALICDKSDCGAFAAAKKIGVKALYIDPLRAGARFSEEGAALYLKALNEIGADLVVLAGFMRIVPDAIINAYEGRIINLHPSLLPAFPGKDSIRQAWDYGVKVAGCTVHHVSAAVDGGKIIAQEAFYAEPSDTFDSFAQKVHDAEYSLLPRVIADFCRKGYF